MSMPLPPTSPATHRAAWLLAGLALLSSAAQAATPAQRFLQALAEHEFLPAYQGFAADSAALAKTSAALCTRADAEKLQLARAQWRAVYLRWRGLDAIQFGPALDLRVGRALDAWPLRESLFQRQLAKVDAHTDFREVGAQAKGLPAIEHLLWPSTPAADTTLGELTGARCSYLQGATRELAREAQMLALRWSPQGGRYVRELALAGHSPQDGRHHPFPTERAALGELVNRIVAGLEVSLQQRLARPAGLGANGAPQPERFEAVRSASSRDGLLAQLAALRRVLLGENGLAPGVDGVLRASGDAGIEAADTVRGLLDHAERSLQALPAALDQGVGTQRPQFEAAHLALRSLLKAIQTELAPSLGITLDFNENDGD